MARFTSRTQGNAWAAHAAARVCGGWQRKIATHLTAAPSSGFLTTISVRLDRFAVVLAMRNEPAFHLHFHLHFHL